MRIIYFLFFLGAMIQFSSVSADVKFSPEARMFQHDIQPYIEKQAKKPSLPDEIVRQYALIETDTAYWAGAVVQVDEEVVNADDLRNVGIHIGSKIEDIWTVRFPLDRFSFLQNINGLQFVEMAASYGPELDKANEYSNVNQVHEGIEELQQAYSGDDVIMAVIDWGFDYTHPQFYDALGEEYRIKAVWDQNNLDYHKPPLNFNYGSYFSNKERILRQEKDVDYLYGAFSHGTHVAGIASGSGAGTKYKGVAPDSDLILISLRRDAPSLIDAFYLIDHIAEKAGKPYVVNMSFGGHYGPHDGTDLPNQAMDKLTSNGKIFVSSAGNNGNDGGFHLSQDFDQNQDTLRSFVRFGDSLHQTVAMWNSPGAQFKTRVRVHNAAGDQVLHETPFVNTADDPFEEFIIPVSGGSREVVVRMIGEESSFMNDHPNKRVVIEVERNQTISLEMVAEEGEAHLWNCQHNNVRYTNNCYPFTDQVRMDVFEDFTAGNDDFGVGEPGGVGKSVLTVGAYTTKNQFENKDGNLFPPTDRGTHEDIAFFSSLGPTMDGRTKPEISGPGNMVVSSVSSYDTEVNSQAVAEEVEFEGRTYQYEGYSGTSMSGPVVAGIVALMLEANPDLTYNDVVNIIQETAIQDDFTGDIPEGGNNIWGAGKANAFEAVKMAENYEAEELPEPVDDDSDNFAVIPNPNQGTFNLAFKVNSSMGEIIDFYLFNAMGKKQKSGKFDLPESGKFNQEKDLSRLPDGIYYLQLRFENEDKTLKIVKQE